MPFASKAQQKFMFAKHPEIAKEFASKMDHKDFEELPEKVKSKKKKKKSHQEMMDHIQNLKPKE